MAYPTSVGGPTPQDRWPIDSWDLLRSAAKALEWDSTAVPCITTQVPRPVQSADQR